MGLIIFCVNIVIIPNNSVEININTTISKLKIEIVKLKGLVIVMFELTNSEFNLCSGE
jgi:hypothetical protein